MICFQEDFIRSTTKWCMATPGYHHKYKGESAQSYFITHTPRGLWDLDSAQTPYAEKLSRHVCIHWQDKLPDTEVLKAGILYSLQHPHNVQARLDTLGQAFSLYAWLQTGQGTPVQQTTERITHTGKSTKAVQGYFCWNPSTSTRTLGSKYGDEHCSLTCGCYQRIDGRHHQWERD